MENKKERVVATKQGKWDTQRERGDWIKEWFQGIHR